MKAASERYVVDRNGRRRAVIIPVARYQRLMEDLHDLRVVAERRSEPTVSLREMKRRLGRSG